MSAGYRPRGLNKAAPAQHEVGDRVLWMGTDVYEVTAKEYIERTSTHFGEERTSRFDMYRIRRLSDGKECGPFHRTELRPAPQLRSRTS